MSKEQNNCAALKVDLQESKDFDLLFQMQDSLQKKIGCDFSKMSIKDIVEFNFKNKHASDDEHSEFMDAIGGINDGIGNAGWKWWKQKNRETEHMTLDDLTENDKLELKFEVVDKFHFFMNLALSVGMTGSELFSMYISKNAENFNRQNNGY